MTDPLGQHASEFLLRCGYKKKRIATFSNCTRLLHDLHLYGDNARDELDILRTHFGVDLSLFRFTKYFPEEFEWGRSTFFWLLGNTPWAVRIRDRYSPITLGMIDQAITARSWIFGGFAPEGKKAILTRTASDVRWHLTFRSPETSRLCK
jgi:hypothetical protein